MKKYSIVEVFFSLQGEGARAGSANVFVRFAGCNLTCNKQENGFDCDTNFSGGRALTADELLREVQGAASTCRNVIFTGGEPTLQLDEDLVALFKQNDFFVCLETNGLRPAPKGVDWISCSPKTAEHTLAYQAVNELRYVCARGQALPKPQLSAEFLYVSPAFSDSPKETREALLWCIELVKANPAWRLSVQQHKQWNVR